MTWREEVLAVEELKQIYEKLYGWTKKGGDRRSSNYKNQISSDENRFSIPKFAKELGVSTGKVSQDLQLAAAIKKYPEIRKCKKKTEALRKLRKPYKAKP